MFTTKGIPMPTWTVVLFWAINLFMFVVIFWGTREQRHE